jgi:hypothetical protein
MELLRLGGRTFDRHVQDGLFVAVVRGSGKTPATYNAVGLVAAYVAHVQRQAAGGGAVDARERKLLAEAQLKELQLAEAAGSVITVEEAKEQHFAVADAVREELLGVSGAAVQAGLIRPEQETALDNMVRDALRHFSETEVRVREEKA